MTIKSYRLWKFLQRVARLWRRKRCKSCGLPPGREPGDWINGRWKHFICSAQDGFRPWK